MAAAFAMACNCKRISSLPPVGSSVRPAGSETITPPPQHYLSACGKCRSCNKIRSGHHPDIIHISPSGSLIKIAQIRDLCHILSMKPYEAQLRVVIISDAHKMNPESGNALLKVLEEPPDQTMLILVSSRESVLLPTIISRCQRIRFSPIPQQDLAAFLMDQKGEDPAAAAIIASMADGSLTKAIDMLEPGWRNRRTWLLSALGPGVSEPVAAQPTARLLAFAERLSKNRDRWAEGMQVLKSWMRDLVVTKLGVESVINTDRSETLQQAAPGLEMVSLLSGISAIETAEREAQSNQSIRLITERLVMQLAGRIPVDSQGESHV